MEPAAKRARMDPGGPPLALSDVTGGVMAAPGGTANMEGASVTLNVMSDLVGKVRAHPGARGAPRAR